MFYIVTTGVIVLVAALVSVAVRDIRRKRSHQERLAVAFQRAQQARRRRPRGLYGESAWTTTPTQRGVRHHW
jgi:hypothetical protein